MAADPERTAAIEGSVARTLRFAADELSSGPDRTASKLQQAATQLDSTDAKEHLAPETMARFRAQIADLEKQVASAERAEKAGRIERDVKRLLSGVEDEIRTNGSQIESFIDRAAGKLGTSDVRECLTPEAIATLQQQLDELRAKSGMSAPKAGPAPAPTPQPAQSSAPPSAPPTAAPSPLATPPSPPPAPAAQPVAPPVQARESEDAQRVRSSIERTIRLAAGEIDAPGWRQAEGYIGQAATQIESDNATQHLTAETLDGFRVQIAELRAQFVARKRADRIGEIEEYLQRLISDAENHVDWVDRIGSMLARVMEVLESEDTTTYLPTDRQDFFRKEIGRLEAIAGGSHRQKAIDDATAALEELEQSVKESSFEGLDENEAYKVWGGFEALKDRVGYALDKVASDDASAQGLRTRLDAVVARRAAAYETTRRKAIIERVSAAWDKARTEIAGWETETQDTSAAALGEGFLPVTREAIRRVRGVLEGSGLFSPIPDARKEYPSDPEIMRIVGEGERMMEAGVARMIASFDAIMDAADQMPIPIGEFELRRASTMAQTARDAFDGTPHAEPRFDRAKALLEMWESTLERVREETEAYYDKLSAEAANAWPAIASAITAEDGFNPLEPSWRGRTVRINGLYNRMGWDFGGQYNLAIWVNEIPVAGNFEPHVLAAFLTAQEHGRMAIDEHKAWDAIVEVGGPGRVKQRIKTTVKHEGTKIGELEEMRPVECVTCRVIALRAGPVAVGPQ